MLQTNINISDALDILIKNKSDRNIIDFLQVMKYSLSNGKNIEDSLSDFDINHIIVAF